MVKSHIREKEPRKSFAIDYDQKDQSLVLTVFDEDVFPLTVRGRGLSGAYRIIKTRSGGLQMIR
jgi:hypothetical protein